MNQPFRVYRSSAGSGKTRTLAKNYLRLALGWKADYFRHILAVTFTNKATQEMKERILHYLVVFSKTDPLSVQEEVDLARELKKELGLDDIAFRERCLEAKSAILHQYGQFSISTIDAFFQKVIRSFTREAGLLGNFRLEVDHDLILDEVISDLFDELGKNTQLTSWMVQFSRERLEEGENWNITLALKAFAQTIFKDDFKKIEDEILKTEKKLPIKDFLAVLQKEIGIFRNYLKGKGQIALDILKKNNITVHDFNYGDKGTAWKYFSECAHGHYFEPKERIRSGAEDERSWPSKKSLKYNDLLQLARNELKPLLQEMLAYHDKELIRYKSADLVLRNFYFYGLISDLLQKLTAYKSENNVMLLSDASKFLRGVINDSDTPFVYEKIGSFYRHYLIDEFQDTSELQWKNFLPLVNDALDQGQESMVVGDVKQSIYRWRGSDLSLLQEDVVKNIGEGRTQILPLKTNFRSAEKIVEFNNTFFTLASKRLSGITGSPLMQKAFEHVVQASSRFPAQGTVRISFYEDWRSEGRQNSLQQVPAFLEELQENGVRPGDIAILVRKNEDGQDIAQYLLQYKDSKQAKSGCRYDVVSNESLRLDSALSVYVLLSALKYLSNPEDSIALGELRLATAQQNNPKNLPDLIAYPEARPFQPYTTQELLRLSIFELTETLIRLFKLGHNNSELAYLQAFQDVILEFASQEKNDINSFLDWWELNKNKKSIQVASETDAINILTIHKAKGLQFKYVLVPFCDWSLNHEQFKSPLVWCKSSQPPFDQLGYCAVRYTKDMEKSFFAEDYHREHEKVFLDNLNLLYVAFTRAELGLFVGAPEVTMGKDPSSAGQLVNDIIVNNKETVTFYDHEKKKYRNEDGQIQPSIKKESDLNTVEISEYATTDWREKLVVRRQGTEFFLPGPTEKRQRINYGILLHTVLSRIHYKNDLVQALDQMHHEGMVVQEEVDRLKDELNQILSHPLIGTWFTPEWQVRNETPVLVPRSTPGRIDRMIFKETSKGIKKAIIIDYKTGEKKEGDREQVGHYATLLSQMGYSDVEAFLIYLHPLEAVPVISKMNLNLF